MFDYASRLVIVSGPSGAGKDTIVSRLIERDERFSLSVSATTRPPRGSEKDGVNYYFLSEDEFQAGIRRNAFVEYAKYGSRYYGTLKCDVEKRIENGKTVILVIDVQGAESVKKIYPGVLSIFIMPPSEAVLEERLRCRMTDSEDEISKRMCIAKCEIGQSGCYDYVVVNDELDKAVDEAYHIIETHINQSSI